MHLASTIDQDGGTFCGIMAIPYDMIVYVAPLQILSEAKMYGDKEEFERYLQGKFAQRPEIYGFTEPVETVSETTHEPLISNQPIQD